MKKILGIVASQRRTGNSEILTKAAMEAAGPGNHRELIRLTDLTIRSCQACYSCLPAAASCHLKDDLNFLLDKIRAADAVVLAAPCYFLGPHGSIKMLQDRLLSVGSNFKEFAGKPCVTITTYGVPGWSGYAEAALNLTAWVLNLRLLDSASFIGANPAEVLENPANPERAAELGRSLMNPDFKRQPRPHECPVCWNDMLRYDSEGVTCPFCGLRGTVQAENGRVRFNFDKSQTHRFSEEGRRHHFEIFLQQKKQEFLDRRNHYKELQQPYRSKDWWVSP